MMKLSTNTTHEIFMYDEELGEGAPFSADIDPDNTVRLVFDSIHEKEGGQKTSRWFSRGELIDLRRIINRALSIIP